MENKIDRLFREKLGGMEVPPAPRNWEAISRGAARPKTAVHWARWAAAAALLLTLGLGYVFERSMRRSEPAGGSLSEAVGSAPAREGQGGPATPGRPQDSLAQPENRAEAADPGQAAVQPGLRQVAVERSGDVKPQPAPDMQDEPEAQSLLTALIPGEDEAADGASGMLIAADQVQQPDVAAAQLADNGVQPEAAQTAFEALPIRIVYKKGLEPEPEPYDKGLMQRGMEKLTALTDELKLSEEAREKLRNTKEDLLAFNIRDLINRKNNENNELEE
jgi:hypothetical protein